jgi:uncharacterized protein (TIGR02452 family)
VGYLSLGCLFSQIPDPFSRVGDKPWRYPLPDFGGVYSPKVLVFRENESKGYAFMDAPVALDFVAVAAAFKPGCVHDCDGGGRLCLRLEDAKTMERKIRVILDIAILTKHDTLVLGAFGCGAYGNPPRDIAEAFHRLLTGCEKYRGRFKNVVFAILDDDNTGKAHNPESNHAPFARIFGQDGGHPRKPQGQ